MSKNILIPLPGFRLAYDLPWSCGLVEAIDLQLRRLLSTGHFSPPRFFGYYIKDNAPIGIAGSWTVALDPYRATRLLLLDQLERLTLGKYSICAEDRPEPEYLLIHDRKYGNCWLWTFPEGERLVASYEPVSYPSESQVPKKDKP